MFSTLREDHGFEKGGKKEMKKIKMSSLRYLVVNVWQREKEGGPER